MHISFLKTLPFRNVTTDVNSYRTFCSQTNSLKQTPSKKYSDTLLLPKTAFPQRISHKIRAKHEATIATNLQFGKLYSFQQEWRHNAPEYILHDGPPYANGNTHIGHAVNKILKDITNRYKLLKGYRINYVPGWDCHGLPIELKAMKESKDPPAKPLEIRAKARKVAEQAVTTQMESFQRWGVMADWDNPYKTFDKKYIINQLNMFYQLFENGLIYREMKPVHWSPSSQTALAEAELEYQRNHESTAVHLACQMKTSLREFCGLIDVDVPPVYSSQENDPVNALVWTTTPWSIPSNEAIAYNENEKYTLALYENRQHSNKKFIVVASACLSSVEAALSQSMKVVLEFPDNLQYLIRLEYRHLGSYLNRFRYEHPWFEGKTCPIVHSTHVTTDVGTGMVHTAPAHGTDDYVLGRKHNLSLDCYVNNDGVFDDRITELKGMPALSLATTKVCKVLEDKIFLKSKYIHPYPYDWRTKKPTIVKTSMQWFIDTDKLKPQALEEISKISIHPPNVKNGMQSQVALRPYWCISRQRVWGVPIPVLIHKETGKPLINRGIIDRLCDLIESSGSDDVWWNVPVETLLESKEMATDYEKGKDIFDIWFDSGVSWHQLGNKQADLYLEGLDQFNGWFQSSLLTSVALRGFSPYRGLYVHGFVVDETGKKMSKSLGNVIDPRVITDGKDSDVFGADVLRWWCATQGSSDADKIAISSNLLRISDEHVQKLRNTLKFLVSFCTEDSLSELKIGEVTYDELMYIDQFMLLELRNFQQECNDDYENFNYHRVMTRALHFATVQVSSQYLTWIKDRLYCDFKESQSRKSCIFVLNEIYQTLQKVIAPVLPHLCEEVHSFYCSEPESIYKSTWFDIDEAWDNNQVESLMELALDLRTTVNQTVGSNNYKTVWAEIICSSEPFQKLQLLHPTNCSGVDNCTSELCDILQLSGIDLKQGEIHQNAKFAIENFGVGHSIAGYSVACKKTDMFQCHRCRRYCCLEGSSLCSRCNSVLRRLEQSKNDGKESPPPPEVTHNPEVVKEEILIRS